MTGCLEVSRGMEVEGYQRDRPTQGATALSQVEPGLHRLKLSPAYIVSS